MSDNPLLFQPCQLRDLSLRNRIAVAPMLQYAAIDGHPTDWHIVHVGRFAAGGAGLIMMESTKVEARGRGTRHDLGLYSDAVVPELARIVDFAHLHGAAIGIQLGHTGRKGAQVRPWEPDSAVGDWELVAPSAIAHSPAYPTPRALDLAELPDVVAAFASAARRADAAGFDTVEIHGAHGYLLHQFLSPVANQRTDRYGGSEVNRRRLLLEVTAAVRAALPDGKPLFVRLSCEDHAGVGIAETVAIARELKALGADVIDCSAGGIRDDMRGLPGVAPDSYGYQAHYARAVREGAGIAAMAVGHIVHANQAEAILRDGDADLVAIGREMLYNPNWAIDAAQKLGVDAAFSLAPARVAYWLEKRFHRFEGLPSTYGAAADPARTDPDFVRQARLGQPLDRHDVAVTRSLA